MTRHSYVCTYVETRPPSGMIEGSDIRLNEKRGLPL